MDPLSPPVQRLVAISRQVAAGLSVAAGTVGIVTVAVVVQEIKAGNRLAWQIAGIGVVGAACMLALLLLAARLSSAAAAVAAAARE